MGKTNRTTWRTAQSVSRQSTLSSLLLAGMFGASAQGAVNCSSLFSFAQSNGISPNALIKGVDGYLYGTARFGGTNGNYGTIFQCSTNGSFSNVYSFSATNGFTNASIQPMGLLQRQDGTLIGASFAGGQYNYGMVFQLSTQGVFQILHSFDNTNGAYPKSGVIFNADDGNYYGTTIISGTNGNNGIVYKLSPAGAFTTLFSFNGTNGSSPYSQLTLGTDGNLYGTTYFGGTNAAGVGTVFRISTNGDFASLFSFDGPNYGANPYGTLMQASDGFFYGTASQGGAYGYGTIFRTDTNGNLSTVFSFNSTNGATPLNGLIQGRDGLLYGQTEYGGTNGNNGTIFSLSMNGVFNSLFSFSGTNGSLPTSPLVQTSSTTFYGVTTGGGPSSDGVFFRFNIIPPSPLLNITTDGTSVYLNWNSVMGLPYQVQSKSDLGNSGWTNNGPVITAPGTNTTVTNTASLTNIYYRLLVAPN